MSTIVAPMFNARLWRPALEKYGAVTHLTVAVYDVNLAVVCGPVPATALHTVFSDAGYDPGIFAECARRCLGQADTRPAVVVAHAYGLAVVGASLSLDGAIVGAAVAGYALVDFSQASSIERLAKEAAVPFTRLWNIVRKQQPLPERRLVLHGELLQVLGDTILREGARARQYEETAADLEVSAAAKDEFLAVLSHELRTPLSPIVAWARILKMTGESDKITQAAEAIERNAMLQVRLVDDLLELNRVSRGTLALDLKFLCLNDIITDAIDAIAETATRKQIAVDFLDADERMCMEADPDRMQQILRNVLTNAVKFTPTGGHVEITLARAGDEAVMSIRDNGQGVDAEFLPFLFDMFRQQESGTRRKHPGLGIGLALVKRLTEAHRGTVNVTSAGVGQGTEVTLRFPLAADTQPVVPAPAANIQHGLDELRVLVVEDTADTREATRMMLQGLGAEVTVAGDGREALDALATSEVDVVLCDLRMPRMDGYEFLRELNLDPDRSHPPVVAVSGLTSSADHQRTTAAGFDGHINKPFTETVLLAEIAGVLARRHSGV